MKLHRYLILGLVALCFINLQAKENTNNLTKAQRSQYKGLVKKANKLYEKVYPQNLQAIAVFEYALLIDSSDATIYNKLGNCYLKKGNIPKAIQIYSKSRAIDKSQENSFALWGLATSYHLNKAYDTAITKYTAYNEQIKGSLSDKEMATKQIRIDKRIAECEYGNAISKSTQVAFIDNMEGINTNIDEYNTVISQDGELVIYSSAFINKKHKRIENVLASPKDSTGNFNKSFALFESNSAHSNLAVVSANEGELYLYDGKKNGSICTYRLKYGKWKKGKKLKLDKRGHIKKVEFSADGNSIIFSNDTKGSFGKQDLYISKKTKKGKWGTPTNLGNNVNTQYDEIAPCIINDSILYFASKGHNSIGGFDIFRSIKQNETWGKAENLGIPLNTPFDDTFYTPIGTGERKSFISSNRQGGKGGMDIYSFTKIIPKSLAEEFEAPLSKLKNELLGNIDIEAQADLDSTKITLLKGIVMNEDSVPLIAKIELADNHKRMVIASFDTDSIGDYSVKLPGGFNYGVSVSADGYLFHSANFDLPEQNEYREIEKNIILKKIEIGKNVILKNIFFETGKADLDEQSTVELANVIKLLEQNPSLHIEVSGHTDNVGYKSYNQKLSLQRAETVVNYLIDRGIDTKRLTKKGYGFEKPVSSNKTKEGRQENRRTEFLVTKI